MCDEYEQKLDRLKALDKKVEELKLKKGEFGLSGISWRYSGRGFEVALIMFTSIILSVPNMQLRRFRACMMHWW